jgi:hypothetical protein
MKEKIKMQIRYHKENRFDKLLDSIVILIVVDYLDTLQLSSSFFLEESFASFISISHLCLYI